MLSVKVLTPLSTVLQVEATKVTAPTIEGEVTILPKHTSYFALLTQGVISVHTKNAIEDFAIDKGYLETDGKSVTILVSRAYGEEALDEQKIQEALKRAQEDIKKLAGKDKTEAENLLRRSMVDLKLLKKRKTHKS